MNISDLEEWDKKIRDIVERVGLRRTEAEKQSPLRHRSSVDPTVAAAIVRAIAREASKRPKPPSVAIASAMARQVAIRRCPPTGG